VVVALRAPFAVEVALASPAIDPARVSESLQQLDALPAILAAVRGVNWDRRCGELVETSEWLRSNLVESGFDLVGGNANKSPAVITIALPETLNSVTIGNLLQESGFLLSYNSDYLLRKNWMQICLMGEIAREKVVALTGALSRICFKRTALHPTGPG
jgi:aspartate aminotransferase-like enzyme